jgi:hypothetical protein
VIPASKTGSANFNSPKEVLEHYMTTDRRLLLLYVCLHLELDTRVSKLLRRSSLRRTTKQGDAVPNAVLAVGMATGVLSRAVNPKEVGPAVRCMSNMFGHAGDK